MKKIVWVGIIILLSFIGYIAAGSFVTIFGIKSGIEKQDRDL